MSKRAAKVWIYAKAFKGEVDLSNFQLQDEAIDDPKVGEFIAEALYLSVDPYQRTFQLQFPTGSVILGRQIARYYLKLRI